MALLKAHQIIKVFNDPSPITILNGVDLEVEKSQSVAIMGRSGEGKSTLLHILGTLEEASSGTIEILGTSVTKKNAPKLRNLHIGFIFQAFHLIDDMTVLQNLLFPPKIGGVKTNKGTPAYNRALELLDRVGLSSRTHYSARLLSGGEKQRVAIARALMNNPELILADEPSGNLDSSSSEKIHCLLLDTVRDLKKGLILVTHNQELANLCDRRVILQQGRLV